MSETRLSDRELHALIGSDPAQGWRAFIEQHTSTLLALVERAGVVDGDEAMEVYVRLCERLSERNCDRLRRRDPDKGPLAAWLAAVVRNVIVDWVRSRAGRRRLFGAIERLDRRHQRVFELYYWEERAPADIAQAIGLESGEPIDIGVVFDALETIDAALTDRHRGELLSFVARARRPLSLATAPDEEPIDVVDPRANPEAQMRARELDEAARRAIAALPPEDAAIVRLRYVQGLSLREIQRALRLPESPERRLKQAVLELRRALGAAPLLGSESPRCT